MLAFDPNHIPESMPEVADTTQEQIATMNTRANKLIASIQADIAANQASIDDVEALMA